MKIAKILILMLLLVLTAQLSTNATTFVEANKVADGGYLINQSWGPYPLGFDFTFFGETFSEFYVGVNGLVGFDSWGMSSDSNSPIPYASAIPNNYIGLMHDALSFYNHGAAIYYQTIGTAPNRQCIIQFSNIRTRSGPVGYEFLGTFMVIISETTNEIQIQYQHLSDLNCSQVLGSSATIGLESSWASYGVQYSYNTASITSGQAINFTPDGTTSYTIDDAATYDDLILGNTSRPGNPGLIYPGNGDVAPQNLTLRWTAATGATGYEVMYDDYPNFYSPNLVDTVVATEYTIPTTLTNGGTYYWTIHALDGNDEAWSHVNRFTVSSSAPLVIYGNAGVANAVLYYTDGTAKSAVANEYGDYAVTVSGGWSGTITPELLGYAFTPANIELTNVTSDQFNQDFTTNTVAVYSISGNAGVANAILKYNNGLIKYDTADGSGDYSILVAEGWTGSVVPELTGYTFAPDSNTYTSIAGNQTDQNYTATINTYTVSGNAGIAEAIITYTIDNNDTFVDTADAEGNYSLMVNHGVYVFILPSKAGYSFSPGAWGFSGVSANISTADFTATPITYTISGNVGLENVILSYDDNGLKADTSDSGGNYSFEVSYHWTGVVKPTFEGYTFSPDSVVYTNVSANQSNQDYSPTLATGVDEINLDILPDKFSLSQNYPNPFNPETKIRFSLPTASEVKIEVFNMLGQSVMVLVNEHLSAGLKEVSWNGVNHSGQKVASGTYLYRITTDQFVDTKKMVLMK